MITAKLKEKRDKEQLLKTINRLLEKISIKVMRQVANKNKSFQILFKIFAAEREFLYDKDKYRKIVNNLYAFEEGINYILD